MAKRSPLRAKLHANRVMMFKRLIAERDNPVVVRERSQRRYKTTPKRARFELSKRAYIVRKHGLAALATRIALLKSNT